MKHQNFVYKIRSHYIILHTHTQTNKLILNSFFQKKKIQNFYLALDTIRTPIVDQTLVQDLPLKIRLEYPSKSCQAK